MKRRTFLTGLGASIASPAASSHACSLNSWDRPLIVGVVGDAFGSFDPIFARGWDRVIARNIHASLFEFVSTGSGWTVEPMIVDHVSSNIEDVSGDTDTPRITIQLTSGLVLSTGDPLSPRHVEETFRRQLAAGFEPVSHYVVGFNTIDGQTIQLTLDPYVEDFRSLLLGPLPGCLLDTAYAQTALDALQPPLDMLDIPTSGKYLIEAFSQKERIVLRCRPEQPPFQGSFEQVVFRLIPNVPRALELLERGEIDVLGPFDDPSVSTELLRIERNNPDLRLSRRRITSNYVVAVNQSSDGREQEYSVKQAVYEAVRTTPISEELAPFVDRAEGYFPSVLMADAPSSLPDADQDRARSAFADAGLEGGSLTLAFNARRELDVALATALQEHFWTLGVQLEFDTDWERYVASFRTASGSAADLTLLRTVSGSPTMYAHVNRMIERSGEGSATAEKLGPFRNRSIPAEELAGVEAALSDFEQIQYVPFVDRAVQWLTRSDVAIDVHPDGQLGSLARMRMVE